MERDTLYTLKSHKIKGFAALTIVMLAAVLASISLLVIEYGNISLNVAEEKQILDSCGIGLGISIIETNNTEEICTQDFLNNCASSLSERVIPNFECVDLGTECSIDNYCERKYGITSSYDPGRGETSKSVIITVPEEVHDVDLIDAAVIMLLDYSGSMNGNRITQLKDTVRQFVNSDFNLSYSVVLYNSNVIVSSSIGKDQQHKQSVLSMVSNNRPNGGTNFIAPLNKAIEQISQTNYESYYILLISDGSPNEGIGPSQNFVENNITNINDNNCIFSTASDPCITIYTLGVDNADTNALTSISGNTLNTAPNEFSFVVNANQVSEAFNSIIEEIMCRVGPVIANGDLNVFNNLQILEENIDYLYDDLYKIIKFYDAEPFNICTSMLNSNAQITLRWGRPKLDVQ